MKKKSGKLAARTFRKRVEELEEYCENLAIMDLTQRDLSWAHEIAVIKLAASFENLMLHALVAAINNDTSQLSNRTGVRFPKHLEDEVCEYILTNGGYFDFHGRNGLISTLKQYVGPDHYLVTIVRKSIYRDSLDRLFALRNFAAHESQQSKKAALRAIDVKRLASTGSWIKHQGRYLAISSKLKAMAKEIGTEAPY